MINFEEELKKFHPSMEIEQVESAVYSHDLTDMTDILLEMMKQKEAEVQAQQNVMQQSTMQPQPTAQQPPIV